jgi:outer membrane protein assembly factor BamB
MVPIVRGKRMKSPGDFPSIGWAWYPESVREGHNQAVGPTGAGYEFVAGSESYIARLGRDGWSTPVPHASGQQAAMAADEKRVYAALHSGARTGCNVLALDACTGAIVWQTRLLGVGSVVHSKYSNRVQMRTCHGCLAVYGEESAGRYTEILDPEDGARLQHEAVRY